jgi:hypothetical protein
MKTFYTKTARLVMRTCYIEFPTTVFPTFEQDRPGDATETKDFETAAVEQLFTELAATFLLLFIKAK